jgi:glycosyltransferase involved in cell wall biosynthesis
MARLGGYYDVKYYRNCDYLIGNTPDIVRWLIEERGWPKERVCNISNFVAWAKMDPLNRNSLDTPSASKLLLALGRLHQNKGFDTLLRALPLLPGTYLWLAGEGPEEASLRSLARDLGVEDRVRFLGWRQDVPALMATADAFVCPSRHEPLGNVILEAWASGTPTVATAAEGPRDLLTSGEDGILVAIDRPDELARAINRVLKDGELARRLAQGGAKTYEARFKEETIVEEYLRIFRKCAESQA